MQLSIPRLEQKSLRQQAVAALWRMLLVGELTPGTRLREEEIASALGISRTPLREALLQLEQEGALVSEIRKGFRVRPQTAAEARDLFSLRAILEPVALRRSLPLDPAEAAGLWHCHAELRQIEDPLERAARDAELHELLVQGCGNLLLLEQIDRLRRLAQWYSAIAGDPAGAASATNARHERLISALAAGEVETACAELKEDLSQSLATILSGFADEPGPLRLRPELPLREARPKVRKVLRVGVLSTVPRLDPRESFELGSSTILGQIFETPYSHSRVSHGVEPNLFSELLTDHGLQDGRHLLSAPVRRDVRFSDGSRLTPRQVARHLASTPLIARQSEVDLDGDRVVFSLRREVSRFDLSLALLHCAIVLDTGKTLLGTGPFMLDPVSSPESLRLVRNPYYREPLRIDEVVFTTYPPDAAGRPEALVAAVQAGEVDLTQALSRRDLPRLEGVHKWLEPGQSTALLELNTEQPALADPRLRRAIAWAIDRSELAAACYDRPESFIATGLLPPALGGGDDGFHFDLDRARALLAEIGSGVPSTLDLLVIWYPRPYLPEPVKVADLIRRQIGRLGIEVRVHQASHRTEFYEKTIAGAYDMLLTGHIPDSWDPVDMLCSLLSSSFIPTTAPQVINEVNCSRFRNEPMDALLEEMRSTPSVHVQARVVELLRSEMPLVPLLYGPTVAVHSRRLHGYRPSIIGWQSFAGLSLED